MVSSVGAQDCTEHGPRAESARRERRHVERTRTVYAFVEAQRQVRLHGVAERDYGDEE